MEDDREPEEPCQKTGGPCDWIRCCDQCGVLFCLDCSREHDEDRRLWERTIGPDPAEP